VFASMFGLGSAGTAGTRGPYAPVVVWRRKMATFKYEAVVKSEAGEEHFERGYVVASSRAAAEQKIQANQLEPRRLHQLSGIKGFVKAFAADIK